MARSRIRGWILDAQVPLLGLGRIMVRGTEAKWAVTLLWGLPPSGLQRLKPYWWYRPMDTCPGPAQHVGLVRLYNRDRSQLAIRKS